MLTLHQSNRLERLARQLACQLEQPAGLPLAQEIVVVQHPGMARWLSLQIATHLGICANLDFPQPAAFIWQVFRAMLPEVPELDRYQPNRLAWRIHALLARVEGESAQQPLTDYLAEGDEVRRFQFAQQLALLFDRYLIYRPEWISTWEEGQSATAGDAWQAELWRQLARETPLHWVRLQQDYFSPAAIRPTDTLPPRVFVFGVPTLSPGYLQIIHHLAEHTDVHLFLLNPCEAHWADIVSPQTQARLELAHAGEQLYLEVGHPLLASLGRQGRDFFAAINELDPGSETAFETAAGDTLLQRLQNQILSLEAPSPGQPADASIAFHICHAPMREVEVLYDQLLDMLEQVPGLAPSEILVMTPEIDRYAPLIEAVFGEPGDRPAIPFRVSDVSLQQGNPLAVALLELLRLPGSRYGVGEMLSLLEVAAVRRRFGLDRAALEAVTEWVSTAAIRWGRDGESKRALDLPPEPRNTWQAGLRRLLLGYAMADPQAHLWHGMLPLDAVEGSASAQLGGLLAFCDAVFELETVLGTPRTPTEWESGLIALSERFFLPEDEADGDAEALREVIHRLTLEAQEAGFDAPVSLGLIRHRLSELLASPNALGFLGGGVNFCALAPMRSLPFRVVCLLGMDDGAFPRRQPAYGFDLMHGQFRFGDRSRRADDRYLFLETLISARDRLHVSYVGRSQRDNKALPPAVVVDELRDTLRQMIGDAGLDGITVAHPLQPFSPDYFRDLPGRFCYSPLRREAALRMGRGRDSERPLLRAALSDTADAAEFTLEALVRFYANPARSFVRERLLLDLEAVEGLPDEREPFTLARFDRADLERRLVEALLRETPEENLFATLDAAGCLPHGQAGRIDFRHMLSRASALSERVQALRGGAVPQALELDLALDGSRLTGRLQALTDSGLLAYTAGRFHPYELLSHWIRHLALNLAAPAGVTPVTQLLEGERAGVLRPVEEPRAQLEILRDHYRQGHNRPLPFYPATAWEYVTGLQTGDEARALARAIGKWDGNRQRAGDGEKPYNRLLWPQHSLFGEAFGDTAVALLQPLIDHLEWH
ncbi:MAG: exodeoxyribonuclease V subunit gamma [Candidatus Thiodiazotropha sp.]